MERRILGPTEPGPALQLWREESRMADLSRDERIQGRAVRSLDTVL